MKKINLILSTLIIVLLIGCMPGLPGGSDGPVEGFPNDFPVLYDEGGLGDGNKIGGFDGDKSLDKPGNRAALTKTPIILIHGNGAHALHDDFGWKTWYTFLKNAGYNDSEIWAVSYLGKPFMAQTDDPHKTNIEDVRKFIDAVKAYLGVSKVDLVGHSLGCGMIRAYMKGLKKNTNVFYTSLERYSSVGTAVLLSGGNYGMGYGTFMYGEFAADGTFMKNLNAGDDSPLGPSSTSNQIAPNSYWKEVTSADDDSVNWVAIIAINDTCDQSIKDTSHLNGANLNKRYNTGQSGLDAHEKIMKMQVVFDDILPYLNKYGLTN